MLNVPVSQLPIPQFPADIRLSVCAPITGGHGTYPLTFQLCAAAGDAVWQWRPAAPLDHPDPLPPQQLAFHELTVSVEKPDRYDMVLLWCCWPIRTDTTGSQRGQVCFVIMPPWWRLGVAQMVRGHFESAFQRGASKR